MNLKALLSDYETLKGQSDELAGQIAIIQITLKEVNSKIAEIEEQVKAGMIGANMNRAIINGYKINVSRSLSTVIEEADELPEEYWRMKREPDTMKIKDALKNLQYVPGAILKENRNVTIKRAQK